MSQNSNGHVEVRRTCFLSFEKQQQVDLDGPLVLSTSGGDLHGHRIAPGAWTFPQNARIPALVGHLETSTIGRFHDLRITAGDTRLEGRAEFLPNEKENIQQGIAAGLIRGVSIGFTSDDFDYEDGRMVINQALLKECSFVQSPANEAAIFVKHFSAAPENDPVAELIKHIQRRA